MSHQARSLRLSVRQLTVRYPGREQPVLCDLNLTLGRGEFVLVAGPSGEGKSTLLSCINGVIPGVCPADLSGEIELDGVPLQSRSIAERAKKIGSVLQNADEQLIFEQIEDELAFPLENLCLPPAQIEARIRRSAAAMQIQSTATTESLSGGEKQRLITATTLGMGQDILLFDEPLANLDQQSAALLLSHLKELCTTQGYSVLFVEHRLDWVLPVADRILWIEGGKTRDFRNATDFKRFQAQKILAPIPRAHPARVPAETLLEARSLSYQVNRRPILEDIDFILREGERWIIIGDNGSGKSTLLQVLAGLLKTPSTRIYRKYPKRHLYQHIGVVLQNPNYQLFMPTVYKEVAYAAASTEAAEQYLSLFGLDKLAECHPHSLSEGQKRKVGVAAILAMEPDVLLLDEPSVGQDSESLACMLAAIGELQSKKTISLISVTHDWRCAAALGDRVLWLEDGRVRGRGGAGLLNEYIAAQTAFRP